MSMKFTYKSITILAAFSLLLATNTISAQTVKKKVRFNEFMLNSYVSGNRFGVQRNPSVGILIGKRFGFSAGPTFNRGFQKSTGTLISLRYYMMSDNESYTGHLRLSTVISFHRMQNQSLSKNALALEQQMAFNMKNDESTNFSELRYKGWEAAAGIGLAYRCQFGLLIRADVSLCYYTSDKQSCYEINSFYVEDDTSLRLGFGLGWSIPVKTTLRASANAKALSVQYIK